MSGMRETLAIPAADILPEPAGVLRLQGLPPSRIADQRIASLFQAAVRLLEKHAKASGLFVEISTDDFARIYAGDGHNAPETPLAEIFPRATHLGLFAATLGPEICTKITALFESRDFALAAMLDAVASEAVEVAGEKIEREFQRILERAGRLDPSDRSLRYSPGYCGWHVSGQRALFAALHPEGLGIALRESFLMQPLKSISGVIVAGPGWIHAFDDDYPFCDDCRSRGCRPRIRRVTAAGSAPPARG